MGFKDRKGAEKRKTISEECITSGKGCIVCFLRGTEAGEPLSRTPPAADQELPG